MFPIENMPVALQYISNIVPTRWYYVIVKSIMLKGLGFGAIWKETLILAAMAVVLVGVSVVKFKKRLE
jgi:ABC-2 type transporter